MSKFSKLVSGDGGHYSIYEATDPMGLLKNVFPEGEANEMNFCLFSTSGVHGTYQTIEEAELGKDGFSEVTFVLVQPRLVTMTYGNISPKTKGDYEYLRKLRRSSKAAVAFDIGYPHNHPRSWGSIGERELVYGVNARADAL